MLSWKLTPPYMPFDVSFCQKKKKIVQHPLKYFPTLTENVFCNFSLLLPKMTQRSHFRIKISYFIILSNKIIK